MVSVGVGISVIGILVAVGSGSSVGCGVEEGCGVGDSEGDGIGEMSHMPSGSVPLMKYSEYADDVATSVFNPLSLQIFKFIRLAGAMNDSRGVP